MNLKTKSSSSLLLLSIVIFLYSCSSKQKIYNENTFSNLKVNPNFPFLLESYNDRRIRNVKFATQNDYYGLATSLSALHSANFDPNPLGSVLDWSMFGLGIVYNITSNHPAFTTFLHPSNFMWMPYISEEKIDFDSFEKKLFNHLNLAMKAAGYNDEDFEISSFRNFGEQFIKILWHKKIVYNKNNIKKDVFTIIEIMLDRNTCNLDLKSTPFKDCLSSMYIYTSTGIDGARQRYNFDKFIAELSKMDNLYLVFYRENKVFHNGLIYNYLVKSP